MKFVFCLRAEELPGGRLIAKVSKHVVAVIDGIIHDIHEPSRDGTPCVCGYHRKPNADGYAAGPIALALDLVEGGTR
jgi:hypothetical protein